MEIFQGYDFDDVLLYPMNSNNGINSREEVVLATLLGNLPLKIPIVASPMKGIVGVEIINKLSSLGGLGILHRFHSSYEELFSNINILKYLGCRYGVAIGLNAPYKDILSLGPSIICVDVANGYLESVRKYVHEVATHISKEDLSCEVMAGNVASLSGAETLFNFGATIIRVGIGSGQLCTTRSKTGVGVPQLTAINDCSHRYINMSTRAEPGEHPIWKRDPRKAPWTVVADGGIKNSGDAVKALASGADVVMLGTLFGNCKESEHNGHISGMASREFQNQFYGSVQKSVEGRTIVAKKEVTIDEFISEFVWNIKSAFTYLNSRTISDLQRTARFIGTGKGSIREE